MKSLIFILGLALPAYPLEAQEEEVSEEEVSEEEALVEADESGTPITLQIPLISLGYTVSRSEGESDRFWTHTVTAHESSYLMFETEILNIYIHPFQEDGAPLSLSRYVWDERLEFGVNLGLSASDETNAAFRDSIAGGWVTYYQLLGSAFIMELSLGGHYERSRTDADEEDDEQDGNRSSARSYHVQGVLAWFYSDNLHLLSSLNLFQRREDYDETVQKSYGMTLLPMALRVFL